MTERIKVVFWDLDGTVWRGTLEEDGDESLIPLPYALEAIDLLDSRGILNSIITQASREAAEDRLRGAGLLDFFVSPQYSVGSKASALANALRDLNLLPRNAALIDDLPFHRAEVSQLLPEVLTLDPGELGTALASERFAPSGMGRERRRMYSREEERRSAEISFSGDRTAFLESCRMDFSCKLASPGSMEESRALELFSRAHRMASTPPGMEPPPSITDGSKGDPIIAYGELGDIFGDYGLIAAAKMDPTRSAPICTRLAISCRVQGRGVLEAFLAWLNGEFSKGVDGGLRILASTESEVNLPLRTSLRFSGYAPLDKGGDWEILHLAKPDRLRVPEWMGPKGTASE